MYEYSPHAKVALHQEIDRLKSENKELREALQNLINIKTAMGMGGSWWDEAEQALKKGN